MAGGARAAGVEADKRLAARYAAGLVEDGMRVGIGSGTTVAALIPALAARALRIRCATTSDATAAAARAAGLAVEAFDGLADLDIAIDGADQIGPGPWLVKGGGRAHTREKIVAAASERFVVIASGEKRVQRIGPPIPSSCSRSASGPRCAASGTPGCAAAHPARTGASSPTGRGRSAIRPSWPAVSTSSPASSTTACSRRST